MGPTPERCIQSLLSAQALPLPAAPRRRQPHAGQVRHGPAPLPGRALRHLRHDVRHRLPRVRRRGPGVEHHRPRLSDLLQHALLPGELLRAVRSRATAAAESRQTQGAEAVASLLFCLAQDNGYMDQIYYLPTPLNYPGAPRHGHPGRSSRYVLAGPSLPL